LVAALSDRLSRALSSTLLLSVPPATFFLAEDFLGFLLLGRGSFLTTPPTFESGSANNATGDSREPGGSLTITATAKPRGDLKKVERAVDEELATFLKSGPTGKELQRVKNLICCGFFRGSERIGGMSDILARNQVFAGNPDHDRTTLARVGKASAGNLLQAA
jgi:zinc protease